ncbi:hypothetical protein [Rufibacter sp. LB8]|uniref:hypothetical protein n=1 Tax=Rufibacter sp. LB8 TaxID=2777781 RepID=UPI00178C7905|nr:hypothetical protein [Rufibacter sp. LB8]
MKTKTIIKAFSILLGIVVLLLISISLLLWLAFGPINSSGKILISQRNAIEYKEIYNGDFAGEFYDVTFLKNDIKIGSYTFQNMDWEKHIFIDSLSNRTFVFLADSSLDKQRLNGYYLISFESNFKNVIDSVYNENKNFNYQDKMQEIKNKH